MPGQHVQDPDPILLETEYTAPAMEALEGLAYGGLPTLPSLDLPSLKLPGVSAEEGKLLNLGMGLIEKMTSGKMPEAYTLGMEKIKSVLAGEYDPTKGDYYKGLKEEATVMTEEGISGIRQRSQLGGMLYSEPAMGEERKLRGQIGTGLTKELGRLFERDIDRQVGMIPSLLGYSEQKAGMPGRALSGIGALAPLAGKGGDIGRQESLINYQTGIQEATFNVGQESKEALFPYTLQAPMLAQLADYGTWSQPTTHYEPGLFDYLLPVAGAAFSK